MDLFKQHKETESKVHESLYTNLALLSGFYPTTKEFDAIFRKDMFVKNNKAAFFEVIYYLLNILNPELTKRNLTSWPPYDLKKEAKFRSEVISYVNSLNSSYVNADIPSCQPSSLISPGGFRFAKFMLKISQLVMYEHLKKSEQYIILHRIKPHRNMTAVTNAQKNHLETETKLIEHETKELLQNFNKDCADTNEKGKEIQKKLEQLNKEIFDAKKLLDETQLEFNEKYPSYPSLESLEEKLVGLKEHIEKVLELDKLFCSSEKLLRYLSGSAMTLEHSEDNFSVPSDVAHIITNTKELNLCQFFQGVVVLLEKRALQLQSPTASCMQQTKEALLNQVEKNQFTMKHLELEQDHINNILDELRDTFHGVLKGVM